MISSPITGKSRSFFTFLLVFFLTSIPFSHPASLDPSHDSAHSIAVSSMGTEPTDVGRLSSIYANLVNYSDVMVIRNLNSPISMEIADYFIKERRIPPKNVCNVSTSNVEVISRATFENLRSQIENYMMSNGIVDSINFIVTTKGVPLKISDSPWTKSASVDSELALINDIYAPNIGNDGWFMNPYFNSSKPFSHTAYHIYIVTRLTAFTVEEAKGLVDKATRAIGRKGRFILDVDPARDNGGYKVGNDWMRAAYSMLRTKGFDVFLDENDTFLDSEGNVSGYTSWGSNDHTWYYAFNQNAGFEADSNNDGIPDGWFIENASGTSQISRSNLDHRSGSWSISIYRPLSDENISCVYQDVVPRYGRRYFLHGYANLTNVSGGQGVFLQLTVLDQLGRPIQIINGTTRTGTTSGWVSLGQFIYEPLENASKIRIAGVVSGSSGTVFLDDFRFVEIKPTNEWIDGSLAETYVSTGGRSFNYPVGYGQSLIADLIRDGVTGVKGYVYEPYLTAVAHPNILFDAYTSGYSLAESYGMASQVFLSWMDAIIGDPKLAPYNRSYLPDLSIDWKDITFTENRTVRGRTVGISAKILNEGGFPALNASVHFYLGDPKSGGQLIGSSTIDVFDASWASTSLNTTGLVGEKKICVLVDPLDEFYELDESNNFACNVLTVLDYITLRKGWNLVSVPYISGSKKVPDVLSPISGRFDTLRFYNSSLKGDKWQIFSIYRTETMNDLRYITPSMGIWIHMIEDANLVIGGVNLPNVSIVLRRGWNLVGYPSLQERTVQEALAGIPWKRIEAFDPFSPPNYLRVMNGTDTLSTGGAIWIKVDRRCTWLVQN